MERHLAADSDRNLWATWRHIGSRVGRVDEDDHVLVVETGAPLPTFNPAFVRAVPDDVEGLIRRAVDREVPVVMTVNPCVEGHDTLVEAAASVGLVARPPLPGMALALDDRERREAPDRAPDLTIERLGGTAAGWDSFFGVLLQAFDVTIDLVGPMTDPSIYGEDHIAAFLGIDQSGPVATSLGYLHDDVVGVYNVSVLPWMRGRGIGERMTMEAVRWGRARGARVAVLQSTEMGHDLYRRIGFETVVEYTQLLPPA